MDLYSELTPRLLASRPAFISVSGAGGKSTFLRRYAAFLKNEGLTVLITTTTKVQSPVFFDWGTDYVFTSAADIFSTELEKPCTAFYAERSSVDIKKVTAPDEAILRVLLSRFDVVICEADGSRCLPLKLHSERDPVIPEFTTATVAVMGASAFGHPASDVCFGYDGDRVADRDFYQYLIDEPEGVLKRAAGESVIIVNQCDGYDYSALLGLKAPCSILYASIEKGELYV